MIPLRDDNPAERPPLTTALLVGVNAAVLAYQAMLGPRLESRLIHTWGLVPATLQGTLSHRHHGLVTLLTSMFLHGGIGHLVGNCWFLWVFGDNVEDVLGHGRFLAFYLACGIAGALGQVAANPSSTVPMIGASGAISGVLGAYFVYFPQATVLTLVPLGLTLTVLRLPAVLFLGGWWLIQILWASVAAGSGGGVAFQAHALGFAAGVVLAAVLGRPARRGRPNRR